VRILVAVATYNQPRITELCLKNLSVICSKGNAELTIYDDCSTDYGAAELAEYSPMVVVFPRRVGIEISRARAFRDFVHLHRYRVCISQRFRARFRSEPNEISEGSGRYCHPSGS
jgi:hypothetical protein